MTTDLGDASPVPRRVHRMIAIVAAIGLAVFAWDSATSGRSSPGPRARAPAAAVAAPRPLAASLGVPVGFVENRGQWRAPTEYLVRVGDVTARLASDAILLQKERTSGDGREGVLVRLGFEGTSPATRLVGEQPGSGTLSVFFGPDASTWRSGIRRFGAVRYERLYDGVDLRVRLHASQLEYDVLVQPGGDLEQVVIRCEGADGMHVDADGALVLETPLGPIRQAPPHTWQESPSGEREPLACRYRVLGEDRYGFVVPGRDRTLALVVDPGLEWSTFLGAGGDSVNDAAVLPDGDVIVTGTTIFAQSFPVTPGAYNTSTTNSGAFVTRLSSDGSRLVYSALIGSPVSAALPNAMSVLPDEGVVIAGTAGPGVPTTPGVFGETSVGVFDAYVLRLSPDGSTLIFATYIGGSTQDIIFDVAVDVAGIITFGGSTSSADYPTTPGAFDTDYNTLTPTGDPDGFVGRFSADASELLYSTFLGGLDSDWCEALTIDEAGAAYVVGRTRSSDFPTTPGAFDPRSNPGVKTDAFVTKLSPDGSALEFSTYLSGSGVEIAYDVALDPLGNITVAGQTDSADFPTTPGAWSTTLNLIGGSDNDDAFVARFDPTGSSLVFSTYLGAPGNDTQPLAIAVDSAARTVVSWVTTSALFPTTPGAFLETKPGLFVKSLCVAQLDDDGACIPYATYMGGSDNDNNGGMAIGLDATGAATVATSTSSPDFPVTPGAFDTEFTSPAAVDGVIFRLDLLPTGASKLGASTPGCDGALAIGVTAIPQIGNVDFGITCTNAGSLNTLGVLALSGASLASPLTVKGAQVWIELSPPFLLLPMTADILGYAERPLPIPADPRLVGLDVAAQFFWAKDCGPGKLASSNALMLTVQP